MPSKNQDSSNSEYKRFSSVSRIYFEDPITDENQIINLNTGDSHHLVGVLKLKANDLISLFNEKSGEWICKIITANKNNTGVSTLQQIKSAKSINRKIHLLYAPLKNQRGSLLLEKITEIGVTHITQVLTNRTTNNSIATDKLKLKLKQASEQCGRLDLPKIESTCKLTDLIKNLNTSLIWLNEYKLGENLISLLTTLSPAEDITLLIGPEGGFTKEECISLTSNTMVIPAYLPGNILRAETAGIVAVSLAVYLQK